MENYLINDIKEHFETLMNARSLAVSNDKRVLEFLLEISNFKDEYKDRFFTQICGALIFKKDEFLNFLDLKLLSDSYTSFSNKIGLGTIEKRFLKNDQNVVLNFPFKDCVLKGGQSKDDDKSTELFFNNILAKSQIDMLFSPKVLDGFELVGGGQNDTLEKVLKNRPNLLIKGNNLIALHTLKEYFRHAPQKDKVKLIYIDPPYNTGNDSFNYNDRFNHSTWLTFMKNRLEIARELLRDDGVIFVQCDDNEQAYLKVLMDEIFGRENFVCNIVWRKIEENASSGGTMKITKTIIKDHEYILCYEKIANTFATKKYLELPNFQGNYKNLDNDPRGDFKAGSISMKGDKNSSKYYEVITPSGKAYSRVWRVTKEEFESLDKDNRIYYGKNGDLVPQIKIFLNEERPVTPKSIFENLGSAFSAADDLNFLFDK